MHVCRSQQLGTSAQALGPFPNAAFQQRAPCVEQILEWFVKHESRAYFKALGAHITRLRKSRGLIQAELARAIGVSQQAMFAYELGERRTSVLILTKLAKVFSITVEELVDISRPVRQPEGRLSPRAMRHAERLQRLPKTQQCFVVRIIDLLEDSNAS